MDDAVVLPVHHDDRPVREHIEPVGPADLRQRRDHAARGSIRRRRPLPASETSSAPSDASARPCGAESWASSAGPPSPPPPSAPVPATGPEARAAGEPEDLRGRGVVDVAVWRHRERPDVGARVHDRRAAAARADALDAALDREEEIAGGSPNDRVGTRHGRHQHRHPCLRIDSQEPARIVLDEQQRAGGLEVDGRRFAKDQRGRCDQHSSELRVRSTRTRRQPPAARRGEGEPNAIHALLARCPRLETLRSGRRDHHRAPERGGPNGEPNGPRLSEHRRGPLPRHRHVDAARAKRCERTRDGDEESEADEPHAR